MRKRVLLAVASLSIALCPGARAQGGVVIRPSGTCGPAVPGDMMVMYSTMNRFITVYVTQIANGTSTTLTFDMRPNAQTTLGCSVRGLTQVTWVIKSIKQPDAPTRLPR